MLSLNRIIRIFPILSVHLATPPGVILLQVVSIGASIDLKMIQSLLAIPYQPKCKLIFKHRTPRAKILQAQPKAQSLRIARPNVLQVRAQQMAQMQAAAAVRGSDLNSVSLEKQVAKNVEFEWRPVLFGDLWGFIL